MGELTIYKTHSNSLSPWNLTITCELLHGNSCLRNEESEFAQGQKAKQVMSTGCSDGAEGPPLRQCASAAFEAMVSRPLPALKSPELALQIPSGWLPGSFRRPSHRPPTINPVSLWNVCTTPRSHWLTHDLTQSFVAARSAQSDGCYCGRLGNG